MSQGFNRQLQNIQRLMDEYVKDINLRDQGFQLGESSNLRRPGNFTLGESGFMKTGKTVPTVYQQPRVQPQAALPGRNTISLPASQKPLLLTTSGKPLPNQSSVINLGGDAGQIAYKLPGGTYTSNINTINAAKQAMAKIASGKANALIAFPELMRLWYGTTNGIKGPGRTVLENSMFPLVKGLMSTPEQREAARQEYIKKYKPTTFPFSTSDEQLTKDKQKELENALKKGKSNNSSKQNGGKSSGAVGRGTTNATGLPPLTNASGLPLDELESIELSGNSPQATSQQQQQVNLQAINDYITKLQEINQPYINALQGYYNNYDDMLKEYQTRKRYWQGIASITGNPKWGTMAEAYNPIANEANKVALVKQIQDAKAGDINAINEAMGNMAIAQGELGLAPEAAFANKNLLTALSMNNKYATDLEKARMVDAMRRYGYDLGYRRAIDQQNLRNQNALDVANIYMGGGGVAPGLDGQGNIRRNIY